MRDCTDEEVKTIRESQANFAQQKAAHRMTTAYGMTYSPHYAQKSREQKTQNEEREASNEKR
jgi:hypothetical protein